MNRWISPPAPPQRAPGWSQDQRPGSRCSSSCLSLRQRSPSYGGVARQTTTRTPPVSCWARPRSHHVDAGQTHMYLVSSRPCNSTSPRQTEQSDCFFFGQGGLCWQNNLANDEPRPLAGSIWAEWETVADGGCRHMNKSISGALDGWDF